MALGSTQPVTEFSTRNLPGSKWRPAHKAGKLATSHLRAYCPENVGASTSHNPMGFPRLYYDILTTLTNFWILENYESILHLKRVA
jgi:hypothetical protein